jgi:SAM-dependent methyltransferase
MKDIVNPDTPDKSRYWDEFYAHRRGRKFPAPSQFAAFIVQEADDVGLIVDVGCGSGRDSVFFARQGHRVLAIDGSQEAINNCELARAGNGVEGVTFHCVSVGSPEFVDILQKILPKERQFTAMIYARFFLHAITNAEEGAFLEGVSGAFQKGDRIALEYRTVRDTLGTKVTPAHYRRFIEPSHIFEKAGFYGLSVEYAVEGTGFAKFREDDAYVARCILCMQ